MNEAISAKPLSAHRSNYIGGTQMEGIHYVTDARGRRKAVQIDLEMHGDLWEDFHDAVVARSRENEPRESFESVKERLRRRTLAARSRRRRGKRT